MNKRQARNTMHPIAARRLQAELDYIEEAVAEGPMLGIDEIEAERRRKLAQVRAWDYSDDLHRHPPNPPITVTTIM